MGQQLPEDLELGAITYNAVGGRAEVVDLFTSRQGANSHYNELVEMDEVDPGDYEIRTVTSEGDLFICTETGEEFTDQTGFGTSEFSRLVRNAGEVEE